MSNCTWRRAERACEVSRTNCKTPVVSDLEGLFPLTPTLSHGDRAGRGRAIRRAIKDRSHSALEPAADSPSPQGRGLG
jgi:hypothetical protein